jgi:hypothetical protein
LSRPRSDRCGHASGDGDPNAWRAAPRVFEHAFGRQEVVTARALRWWCAGFPERTTIFKAPPPKLILARRAGADWPDVEYGLRMQFVDSSRSTPTPVGQPAAEGRGDVVAA